MSDHAISVQAQSAEAAGTPAANLPRNRRTHSRSAIPLRLLWLTLLVALLAVFVAGIPDSYELLRAGAIGIYMELGREGQTVITPIPGQAAERAGVRRGDVLLAVDGVPVPSGGLGREGTSRMRVAAGEPVTLTIARTDGEVVDLTFNRRHAAQSSLGITPEAYALALVGAGVLFVLAYSIPAAVIALRRPNDWMAALIWLTLVLIAIFNSRANAATRFSDSAVGIAIAAAYQVAVLLVLLTFPDGRFVPRWTRWYLLIGVAWIAVKLSPIPPAWELMLSPAWVLIDFLVFGLAISAQLYRYRKASDPVAKQQTKWLVYGFLVAFLVQYAYYIPHELVPGFQGRSVFEFVGSIINHLLMLIVPVAFTYAILRYRLYDIDLIINRTLVYVPLTAIVAGVYTASVVFFRNLFVSFTGETSDAVIVLSTLVIVAVINPLKDVLQGAVDERFQHASRADRVLQDFELQLSDRMHAVQAGPVIRRLLEHAVRAYDAPGGAAYLVSSRGRPRLLLTAGEWVSEGAVSVEVRNALQRYGVIKLCPPRSGSGYSETDLERLRTTAALVGAAIEEDRNL